MSNPVIDTAIFCRDILSRAEGTVVILGRANMRRNDFNSLQIVIDQLGAAQRMLVGEKYDGTTEVMQYSNQWRVPMTINFYGDGARDEAVKFVNLTNSQAGYEKQRDLGLTINATSSITDLKFLTGEQFSERYEIELSVIHTESTNVETLRIDTAEPDVINDK